MDSKEKNRKAQEEYYKNNKKTVLRNRYLRKIRNGELVRPSTLKRYKLVEEAKAEKKFKHNIYNSYSRGVVSNKVTAPDCVSIEVAKRVEARVEQQLEAFDNAIKRAKVRKLKMLETTKAGRKQYPSGKINLEQAYELINQVVKYESVQTKKKYRADLRTVFERFLKNKPEYNNDIIGTFRNASFVIDAIEKGKTLKKTEYAGKKQFFILPITLYENIEEFGEFMTEKSYKKYKAKWDEADVIGMMRSKENKVAIPHISQFHLARLFYAQEFPGTMEHLVTALYTLEPAKRRDYGCVRLMGDSDIIKNETEWEKNNWLKLPSGTLILHKFKTGKTYKKLESVFDPKLTKLIQLWLKKSGNKQYLITKDNGKAFSECLKDTPSQAGAIGSMVTDAFNFYLKQPGDPNITINTLRQAWVNSLKDGKVSDRIALANKMGHSLQTAMAVYERPDQGAISDFMEKGKKLKDYGEKGYYYNDKEILNNTAGRLGEMSKLYGIPAVKQKQKKKKK